MPVLQFKGKTAIETYHHTVPHHALEFEEKLSVLGRAEKPSLEGNLIIEGDNLIALKALLPTHAGKIKCIYIDPPYNTGDEGWVYNDNLTQPQFKEWIGQAVGKEEEDACRHDKWCCMMYPRLMLLRELLHQDGVIFVSIDENEVSNLSLLMEEIFGPACFISCMVWKARQYPDARATTGVSTDHEYLLVYGKKPGSRLRGGERDENKYTNPDNDSRGDWMSRSMLGLAPKAKRPNLHYTIYNPKTKQSFDPPAETGWRYKSATMLKKIKEDRILFPKDPEGRPREKVFLKELQTKFPGLPSIIDSTYTSDGTEEIREIFGSGVFQFPKPSELIRLLIEQITDENDWVLDSFAGSGTTGHAVLKQNEKDEGLRRFILVQQPHDTKDNEEKHFNICQKITAERVKRVMNGYKFEGSKVEVLLEEKIGLNTLKNSQRLLDRIEAIKLETQDNFDDLVVKCESGVVKVLGTLKIKGKTEGLGGSFGYVRLSEKPILGEYRDITKNPPSYEEIAKYVYYTETSEVWNQRGLSSKIGKIGEHHNTSLYLLYTPNQKDDQALDMTFLNNIAVKDKNPTIVIYCEKIWIHRSELLEWSAKHKKTIRPMIVPFNLK